MWGAKKNQKSGRFQFRCPDLRPDLQTVSGRSSLQNNSAQASRSTLNPPPLIYECSASCFFPVFFSGSNERMEPAKKKPFKPHKCSLNGFFRSEEHTSELQSRRD